MPVEQFVTPSEAAALPHLSPETVRRRCRDGQLPAVRVGVHRQSPLRIPMSALLKQLHDPKDESRAR
jgi:excisionase family DNA binding protein